MLRQSENELLTRVGPGTPMGELMRRYWHPVAASKELDDNPFRTKEVRILGEDLVLYRDRSGALGLIDRFCSHRRVNLAIGVVEEDGIRCQYHGWKFDRTGACVEQPFEQTIHPEGTFKEKCGVAAYQVQERAGLVFAYLGPSPAPLLPNWEPLVWDNAVRDIAVTELPCNWLQCQENSLDPVHVEWLHVYFGTYVRDIFGGPKPPALGNGPIRHKKIGFDTFDYGIIKRRLEEGKTEDDDDWKHGHPILFPNILFVGSQFSGTLQFRVPMDDTHTYHVSLYTWRAAPGTVAPAQRSVPYRVVPLQRDGQWVLNYIFNQDYMAWVTQGPITNRHLEKLGESDRGIILFRRMLMDQIARLKAGADPMCTFRDPSLNQCLQLPLERVKFGAAKRPPRYVPAEAGYSEAAAEIDGVLATWDALQETRAEILDEERVAV